MKPKPKKRSYTRHDKQRAMLLYASGKNFEQIAAALSDELKRPISATTPARWKDAQVPADWEEARRKLEVLAASEALARLARERGKMTARHYDDLEMLRAVVKRIVVRVDEVRGKRKMVLATGVTAQDVRAVVAAYRDVLQCQRLILGLATERIGEVDDPEARAVIILPAEDIGDDDEGALLEQSGVPVQHETPPNPRG